MSAPYWAPVQRPVEIIVRATYSPKTRLATRSRRREAGPHQERRIGEPARRGEPVEDVEEGTENTSSGQREEPAELARKRLHAA